MLAKVAIGNVVCCKKDAAGAIGNVVCYNKDRAVSTTLCVCYNGDAAFQHSTAGEGIGRSLQREATRGQKVPPRSV